MKKNIPAVLILSLLISIFFWKFFLFGYLPLPSDILHFYWPPWKMASLDEIPKNPLLSDALDTLYSIAHYSQEIIKDGRLSLWNPHTFCGIPMFAFFTFSLLHPLSYLSYLFSPQETYALTIMLQLFLAGLFMYLFLRISLKIGRFGALVGSTVFMFNGVFMVWLEFITTIGSALYFPLIFLLIDKTISKKSLTYSLLGAILLAIVIFSSHLQNLLYLILAFFFYALFRILLEYRQKRHFRQLARPILLVVASFVLGILLSFIYLLPLFEQTTLCHRSEFKFKELNPLPVANLVTFVIPDFYGTPAPPHSYGAVRGWFYKTGLIKERPVKVGGENYNEYCGYIGVLPLILALLAGLLRRDRDTRFFFCFWIVSLLLALGTFLYLPLYWFAPGFNKMGISRVIFLFCFSGSILAGMGAEYITGGRRQKAEGRRQEAGGRREELVIRVAVWVLTVATLGWLMFLLLPKFNSQFAIRNSQLELLAWHFSLKNPSMSIPVLLVIASILILILSLRTREFATKAQRHKEDGGQKTEDKRQNLQSVKICEICGSFVSSCLGGLSSKSLWLKGAILVVISFDLLYFGMKYNPMTPREWLFPETPSLNFLTDKLDREPPFRIVALDRILPPNTNLVYRLQSVEGYESLHSARYHDFMKELVSPDVYHNWIDIFSRANRRFLHLLNVKYVLADRELRGEDLRLVYDGEIKIYEDLRAYPRAWIVSEAKVLKTKEEIFEELKSPDFDPRKTVILEGGIRNQGLRLPTSHFPLPTSKIVEYQPEKVVIEASLPQAGFLVLSDSYYPGWKVFVDGEGGEVLRANYIMRAVKLSPGHHQIEFIYDPPSFKLGLAISLATLFLILVLIGYEIIKNRRGILSK